MSLTIVLGISAALEEEQKLVDAIAEIKQAHTRKIRALRAQHQSQLNEYKAISSQLALAAEMEMAKAAAAVKAQQESSTVAIEADTPSEFKEQRIRFLLRSPEICLLKNAESSKTAFVIHLGDSVANVTLRNPDPAKPDEALKDQVDFQLISFDAHKADIDPVSGAASDKILLLQPFDVSFKLENSRVDESIVSKVDLSSLNTIISYQDLRLAMNVFETFSPVLEKIQAELEKEKQLIDAVSSTFADAAAQAKAVAARRMTIALPGPVGTSRGPTVAANASSNASQAISIRISKSTLSILNDTIPEFVVPLFKAQLGQLDVAVDLSSDFNKVNVRARDIALSAYNVDLSTYEPIIEPWDVSALIKQNNKTDFVALRLTADKTLDLNVGKSLIDAVFNIQSFVAELLAASPLAPQRPTSIAAKLLATPVQPSSSGSLAAQGRSFSPFVIKNETSVALSFWFSHETETKSVKVAVRQSCNDCIS